MKQATHFAVHKGWKILLTDMGINPADMLALAGLPQDLFSRKSACLTPAEYFQFWTALEMDIGSEELPLKIGQAISVEAFDTAIFACLCSPDLKSALQRLSQYKRLIGPMILDVDVGRKKTAVSIECYGHAGSIPRSLGATELVFLTQLARLTTRARIIPAQMELPHVPENSRPYEVFFGRNIHKGERVRIVFSGPDASRPFLTADAGMWDFFESRLNTRLSDLDYSTSTAQRVKSALFEMLPTGLSTIDETAKRLAMSTRSLQRQLQQESISYQAILNDTRKELAQHYLGKSAIYPSEISYLLGYQDSNSFIRAFKGWTGMTPGEYRQPATGGSNLQH